MRAGIVALAILTAALWAVVLTLDGHIQATAFLTALFGTAVTVGLTVALTIDLLPKQRLRAWTHQLFHPRQAPLCSACSRTMARVGDMLMCGSCDGVAARVTG